MLFAYLHKQAGFVLLMKNSLLFRAGGCVSVLIGIEFSVGFHFCFRHIAHEFCHHWGRCIQSLGNCVRFELLGVQNIMSWFEFSYPFCASIAMGCANSIHPCWIICSLLIKKFRRKPSLRASIVSSIGVKPHLLLVLLTANHFLFISQRLNVWSHRMFLWLFLKLWITLCIWLITLRFIGYSWAHTTA